MYRNPKPWTVADPWVSPWSVSSFWTFISRASRFSREFWPLLQGYYYVEVFWHGALASLFGERFLGTVSVGFRELDHKPRGSSPRVWNVRVVALRLAWEPCGVWWTLS